MALAAGVVRLAQKRTLVHDMGCIETLARVDVLCVDKTGTVTENKMTVEDVVPSARTGSRKRISASSWRTMSPRCARITTRWPRCANTSPAR